MNNLKTKPSLTPERVIDGGIEALMPPLSDPFGAHRRII